MYIGPWQEYRLAKIQDDAIQRLKKEWEDQLRGQMPTTEDARIRELMQPLMAKLPSLLAKTKGSSTSNGTTRRSGESRCSSRPQSARSIVSSTSTTRSGVAKGNRHPGASASNQDTHEEAKRRSTVKPPKPTKKKGKKAPLTALEQVQKRKKMFATWIKQAGNDGREQPSEAATVQPDPVNASTRLPIIPSVAPANAAALLSAQVDAKPEPPLVLPPLTRGMEKCADPSSSPLPDGDFNLDESVDEEEVNNLLNWTDTLLSPHAMDSFCDFDD